MNRLPDGRPGHRLVRLRAWLVALALATAAVVPALAKEAAPEAADPALEARMQAVASELRCLVCQNQTIADSQADLAVDLRRQVREMLQQGRSEREIVDYMTARYGDFVLYRPPVQGNTLLLWGGPLALMLLGIVALIRHLRRRATRVADDRPLSADETSRADALLKEINPK